MAYFFTFIAPDVIFSKDQGAVLAYFTEHKLLPDDCICSSCHQPMDIRPRPTTSDCYGWR